MTLQELQRLSELVKSGQATQQEELQFWTLFNESLLEFKNITQEVTQS